MYGKALRKFLSQSHPSEEDHLPQEQALVSMVTLSYWLGAAPAKLAAARKAVKDFKEQQLGNWQLHSGRESKSTKAHFHDYSVLVFYYVMFCFLKINTFPQISLNLFCCYFPIYLSKHLRIESEKLSHHIVLGL